MKKQRYELIAGKSAKFWEVQVKGSSMTTAYGRIGTKGQSSTKKFADADTAKEAAQKLIQQKVNKGYSKAPERKSKQSAKPRTKKRSTRKKVSRKAVAKKVNIADLSERDALKHAKEANTPQSDLRKLLERFIRVDRALAKRDDLSPISLEKLSHSSDRITRRNVASNANCTTSTLLHLAPQFPAEFLGNPLFDWMLIEDPHCLGKLDDKVLLGLLKREACPEAFLRWAADHGSAEVKLSLISNKRVPKDVLEKLARSRNERISAAARGHEKLAPEIDEDELEQVFLDAVLQLLSDNVSEARRLKYIGLAQFPYVSEEERLAWALRGSSR